MKVWLIDQEEEGPPNNGGPVAVFADAEMARQRMQRLISAETERPIPAWRYCMYEMEIQDAVEEG